MANFWHIVLKLKGLNLALIPWEKRLLAEWQISLPKNVLILTDNWVTFWGLFTIIVHVAMTTKWLLWTWQLSTLTYRNYTVWQYMQMWCTKNQLISQITLSKCSTLVRVCIIYRHCSFSKWVWFVCFWDIKQKCKRKEKRSILFCLVLLSHFASREWIFIIYFPIFACSIWSHFVSNK